MIRAVSKVSEDNIQGSVASLIPNFALEVSYPQSQKSIGGQERKKKKKLWAASSMPEIVLGAKNNEV